MEEDEKQLGIFLTGFEEDGPFIRAVAAALEAMGHETELPARLEDYPGVVSELKKRARRILREMKGPQPLEMELRIFLSFSSHDAAIVREFGHELGHRGMRFWNFTSSMFGFGPYWIEGELKALSTCSGFTAFLSKSSLESVQVGFEIDFILERISCRSGIFFCIVLLEELPLQLPEPIPVIDLSKTGVAEAAKMFIEKAVTFYRSYIDSTHE
jgi:hypothetical protein